MQTLEDSPLKKGDVEWVSSSEGIESLREIRNRHEIKEKKDRRYSVFDF